MRLSRTAPFALVLLFALGSGACVDQDHYKAPQTPSDDYDQQGWANTSPDGPGSETSTSYYGVGASPSPDEHQPADPQVSRHQPH